MAGMVFRSSSVLLVFFLVAAVAALLLVTAEARSYGVSSLSKSSCRFAQNLQSGTDLGDDRSPMVVGSSGIYYVSDDGTGSFFSNLTLRTTTETRIDGLFSDLGNGRLWTFATSSSDWLDSGEDAELSDTTRITHLIPLVADSDGILDTDESREVVALSTALNPYWADAQPMLFLGMGEFVFASSIEAPSEFAGVFHVDIAIHEMASGESWVTDPVASETENWAASGVMERSGESIWLLAGYAEYAMESVDDTGGIYRYRIDGSLHSKLYTGFLDDAATFAVNYWSGDNKRWFTHGESAPMRGDTPRIPGLDQSEWILSCAADHWTDSGAATMSCAVCSLASAFWSSLFFFFFF